ncbi:hypothetical protein BGZ83_002503, partial [Gryganskiella cystojenkinii]
RPVYLHLEGDISLVRAYVEQGSGPRGPVRPLQQLYGYMKHNGFRYGVLSTYTQSWFAKRVEEHGVKD